MKENKLILFTRVGCCLCEGLEERLRNIPLDTMHPPVRLCVKDIDSKDVSFTENARYSLEVPVLLLELEHPLRIFQLPRVSPRLSEEGLLKWLEKTMQEIIEEGNKF